MSQSRRIFKSFSNRLTKIPRLSTGFSMLEAVVVVGILLALAVGGFFAYGPIAQNAKVAAVKSAASSVYTAILVAQSDGDPSTSAADVVDDHNSSNDKLRAEIRQAGTEVTPPAMSVTGYAPTSDNDFCVRVTNVATPTIYSEMGNCKVDPEQMTPADPEPAATPAPNPAPTVEPTATPAPSVQTVSYPATWGRNNQGQLGNGSFTDSNVSVEVNSSGVLAGKKITSISSGGLHTCAVADGDAYCWGHNGWGQLGNGSTVRSNVPVAVNTAGVLAGKTISSISSAFNHTCAISGGAAYCWGSNSNGQLGNGSTTYSSVPVAVNTAGALAGKTITSISSGGYHTCAVADGAAYCWGYNNYGQLGNGSTTYSSVPVLVNTAGVLAGKTITSISNENNHTCAVADGAAYCWGYNYYGQLGNGSTVNSNVPVVVNSAGVLAGKVITSISSGGLYTCAISGGAVYCWGANNYGQLGNGSTTTQSNVPVAVNSTGVLAGKTITSITNKDNHTCALADGAAYCWGYNYYGQLGNGSTANSNVPVAVNSTGSLAGKSITSISSGGSHTSVLYK